MNILAVKNLNKNNENPISLSDKEYSEISIKILKYLYKLGRISTYKYRQLKSNDEYFSYIKHAIMLADWRHDDKRSKLSTWRIVCVNWEIYRIFNEDKKLNKLNFSEFEVGDELKIEDLLEDKFNLKNIDSQETYQNILKIAQKNLSTKALSIFTMYFQKSDTIKEIAKTYETSPSEIRNSIKTSIKSIRKKIFDFRN